MRSRLFLSLLCFLAFIPGCKKGTTFSGAKVYVLTDFKAGIIYTYSYNSDGTTNLITKNTGGKTTFGYTSGNVLVSNINNSGTTTDATNYVLNSSGYAQSSQGQFQSQALSSTYTYDASGHLIEQKNYSGTTQLTDIVNTFPSTTITQIDVLNNTTGVHSYDRYSYVTNITISYGVQNKGQNYLGVSSNNPILADYKVNNAGDTTDIITYRYHYDGSSRVDTFAAHNKAGFLTDSIAFTYY